MSNPRSRITVARGDGIGPEIMDCTLRILAAANAPLDYDMIEIGEAAYLAGNSSGIPAEAWEIIRRNAVFLKAPITTPQGGGYKSLNVTIRKSLNLFANVRPSKAFSPFVESPNPDMDLVIVRENEEDLYAGIEYQQTREVVQSLKLISRPGSERIVRYAFEYARAYGRKKVTCMTKDNIMKHADGLFHKVFREVSAEYPDIQAEHQIIDIGTARLASSPEDFDVIVTLNLYGDILSDVASQITGSVGLGGSANVGTRMAMFEAVHGSAPDLAGKGVANPSGLLLGAIQMLVHLGHCDEANAIMNAWLKTLEDGIHTGDIFQEGQSTRRVGSTEFTDAVIERLGQKPGTLEAANYSSKSGIAIVMSPAVPISKEFVGVDVFVDWAKDDRDPSVVGRAAEQAGAASGWTMQIITNRGVRVNPGGMPETFCSDHWRVRYLPSDESTNNFAGVLSLLGAVHAEGLEVIKTEHLYDFNGERGYTLGQGE